MWLEVGVRVRVGRGAKWVVGGGFGRGGSGGCGGGDGSLSRALMMGGSVNFFFLNDILRVGQSKTETVIIGSTGVGTLFCCYEQRICWLLFGLTSY